MSERRGRYTPEYGERLVVLARGGCGGGVARPGVRAVGGTRYGTGCGGRTWTRGSGATERRRERDIVCALGHRACRNGISTRHYRLSRLLDELVLVRGDGTYPKLVQRLARTWLLILDDWGLAPLSGQARHDLLEILDDRYARRGTLLASQVPVEHWHDVVGDPTFGDAILDRLLNNAHRITLKGGSMRRLYDSTKTGDSR